MPCLGEETKKAEVLPGFCKIEGSGGRGGAQCVELKLRWQFCVHTSTCHAVVYQKPKLSAETESFQLSAFGFGRRK